MLPAQAIHSVNTIVNTRRPSEGAQHRIIAQSLAGELQGPPARCLLCGSGGMGVKAAACAEGCGFTRGYIVAIDVKRSGKQSMNSMAMTRPDTDGISRFSINATPIGMAGGNDADKLSLIPNRKWIRRALSLMWWRCRPRHAADPLRP